MARDGFELVPKLPGLTPDTAFPSWPDETGQVGQRVADIAEISYPGFGGTAKHALARHCRSECGRIHTGKHAAPRPVNEGPRSGSTPIPWAQAIPNRARCSSHAIGRRVSPASFFAVSSSGWRSLRMVFTTSGARKLSRRMRVKVGPPDAGLDGQLRHRPAPVVQHISWKRCAWLKSLSRLRSGDFRALPSRAFDQKPGLHSGALKMRRNREGTVSSLSHKAGSKVFGLSSSQRTSSNRPGAIRISSVSCVSLIR